MEPLSDRGTKSLASLNLAASLFRAKWTCMPWPGEARRDNDGTSFEDPTWSTNQPSTGKDALTMFNLQSLFEFIPVGKERLQCVVQPHELLRVPTKN